MFTRQKICYCVQYYKCRRIVWLITYCLMNIGGRSCELVTWITLVSISSRVSFTSEFIRRHWSSTKCLVEHLIMAVTTNVSWYAPWRWIHLPTMFRHYVKTSLTNLSVNGAVGQLDKGNKLTLSFLWSGCRSIAVHFYSGLYKSRLSSEVGTIWWSAA